MSLFVALGTNQAIDSAAEIQKRVYPIHGRGPVIPAVKSHPAIGPWEKPNKTLKELSWSSRLRAQIIRSMHCSESNNAPSNCHFHAPARVRTTARMRIGMKLYRYAIDFYCDV